MAKIFNNYYIKGIIINKYKKTGKKKEKNNK